jgi:hypothetical protein
MCFIRDNKDLYRLIRLKAPNLEQIHQNDIEFTNLMLENKNLAMALEKARELIYNSDVAKMPTVFYEN